MTTIAYRNGVLAADSRVTVSSEAGGDRTFNCEKLFRKFVAGPEGAIEEVILATAGDSTSGMVFVDWYGSGHEPPVQQFIAAAADFTVLVLRKDGLWEYDAWCRGMQIKDEFYAVGSGTKLALGAMEMGASALKAVEIAARRDPYTAAPFLSMRLKNVKPKSAMPKMRKADDAKRESAERKDPVAV